MDMSARAHTNLKVKIANMTKKREQTRSKLLYFNLDASIAFSDGNQRNAMSSTRKAQ